MMDHQKEFSKDFMLQHLGEGGNAVPAVYTIALEVLLHNASDADRQLWFIILYYQPQIDKWH